MVTYPIGQVSRKGVGKFRGVRRQLLGIACHHDVIAYLRILRHRARGLAPVALRFRGDPRQPVYATPQRAQLLDTGRKPPAAAVPDDQHRGPRIQGVGLPPQHVVEHLPVIAAGPVSYTHLTLPTIYSV